MTDWFQVTVKTAHKGIVINAGSAGSWDAAGVGYQNKGTCVTHSSRARKTGSQSFVFRARSPGPPSLSGYLVSDYSSYSPLRQHTLTSRV